MSCIACVRGLNYCSAPCQVLVLHSLCGNHYTIQSTAFDDHQLGTPAALMVNTSTAVSWELLDDLDVRMRRCPFTWRELGREYWQLHSDADFPFKPRHVSLYLMRAWQWRVVLLWITMCRDSSLTIPSQMDIRRRGERPWQPLHAAKQAHLPVFRDYFHKTFAEDHAKHCTGPDPELCGSTVITDGNMKICRSICPCSSNKRITSKWLGKFERLPCGKRPRRKKRTCAEHARKAIKSPSFRRVLPPKSFMKRRCEPCASIESCNTERTFRGRQWHRSKGLINAVYPCGVVATLREMFHHESRTQICACWEDLRRISAGKIKNFGYDDGCHVHESIEKAAREGNQEAIKMLAECDVFIDPWHLRGHKRESCKVKFNPLDRPYGRQYNAIAAEQCWRYVNKHRHCVRYLDAASFELHLLWVMTCRNDLLLCRLWDR